MKHPAYGFSLALLGLPGGAMSGAHANDSVGWISTGGVQYLKSNDIRMVSEDLYISTDKIRVQYEFINDSAQAVQETVLFPLPAMRLGEDGDFADVAGLNNSFKVWVNDKPVTPQKNLRVLWGKKDITEAFTRECRLSHAEITDPFGGDRADRFMEKRVAPCLQTLNRQGVIRYNPKQNDSQTKIWDAQMIYSWQQTFPAKQSIRVRHEYAPLVGGATQFPRTVAEGSQQFKRNYCIDNTFMSKLGNRPASYSALGYILTTGANWAKPIERFHLTVDKPKDSLLSMCWDASLKKISDTRFEANKTQFTPSRDLEILFAHPRVD